MKIAHYSDISTMNGLSLGGGGCLLCLYGDISAYMVTNTCSFVLLECVSFLTFSQILA